VAELEQEVTFRKKSRLQRLFAETGRKKKSYRYAHTCLGRTIRKVMGGGGEGQKKKKIQKRKKIRKKNK